MRWKPAILLLAQILHSAENKETKGHHETEGNLSRIKTRKEDLFEPGGVPVTGCFESCENGACAWVTG